MRKLLISLSGNGITKTLVSVDERELYDLRVEMWDMPSTGSPPTRMVAAYNKAGDYIGNAKAAEYLCDKRGIAPEVANPKVHTVCSIGFSAKDGKWYGWSHRANYGFQIGDTVKPGDCAYTPERGEWTATTIEEAKQMAIDFAESVSTSSTVEKLKISV